MILSSFDIAVDYVLSIEKGLSENPHDLGGITNFGISLRFLKAVDPENLKKCNIFDLEVNEDTIRHLTVEQAKSIYKIEFWDHAPFGKISNQDICNYIFSMSINMGIANAIKCAQRACWSAGGFLEKITDDGILGNDTLAAIAHCGFYFLPAARSECAGHYRAIVISRPDQLSNLKGWLNRAYNL